MSSGRFFYGLMRIDRDLDLGHIGLEHEGKPGRVFTLRDDSIAALVSEFEVPASVQSATRGEVLPLRKNLKPYHDVIREAMKTATIAPMQFAHVADSEQDIMKLLQVNRAGLDGLLGRIEGKVEMGLQVRWAVENVFEYFMETHPELRQVRDEVFGPSHEPSQVEKMDLGEMFVERLTARRDECGQRVKEMLRSCCGELADRPPKDDTIAVDLACLVDRGGLEAFVERVRQIAAEFGAEYVFDYGGPWAPYSFVDQNT